MKPGKRIKSLTWGGGEPGLLQTVQNVNRNIQHWETMKHAIKYFRKEWGMGGIRECLPFKHQFQVQGSESILEHVKKSRTVVSINTS